MHSDHSSAYQNLTNHDFTMFPQTALAVQDYQHIKRFTNNILPKRNHDNIPLVLDKNMLVVLKKSHPSEISKLQAMALSSKTTTILNGININGIIQDYTEACLKKKVSPIHLLPPIKVSLKKTYQTPYHQPTCPQLPNKAKPQPIILS
jgi:hypothetical protein